MEKALRVIADIIEEFRETKNPTGEQLTAWLKNLSAWLFYLEEKRSKYHDNFELILHSQTKEGVSVSKAKNIAEVQVPELYMLRRQMDAAYRVCDAQRTYISWIKSEKKHSN